MAANIGERFGRLVILEKLPRYRSKCLCDCGALHEVFIGSLTSGRAKSCGCLKTEVLRARSITHSDCLGRKHSTEYTSWSGMIYRCKETTERYFKYYAGRGITVCDRWLHSFENFLADMGRKPTPTHTIDRRNNDGDYEPSNCRWATKKEQANNSRRWKEKGR